MSRRSFKRNAVLAGIAILAVLIGTAVFMFADPPLLAEIRPQGAAATPVQPSPLCPGSTMSTKQLAMMNKAGDRDFQCLGVSLNDGSVIAIRVETHSFTPTRQQPNQEQVKTEDFSRSVLESSRGAVLDGIPGHDAIVLRGHFAAPSGEADLVASYLFNGFTGEYHSCQLRPDDAPDTGWRLVNRFDRTVSHIVVRTRQMPVIGMFGIADLEGACS
jgi:hypothetical protein